MPREISEFEAEYLLERYNEDPLAKRFEFKSFRSTSSGQRRKKRRPRYIDLLVVDRKYAFTVKDGEIKPRKQRNGYSQPDELAAEMLTDLPWNERTTETLLARVIAVAEIGMMLKENGYL